MIYNDKCININEEILIFIYINIDPLVKTSGVKNQNLAQECLELLFYVVMVPFSR